ncbi:unnamed protein product [Dovyalis caffra]|uniref:Uncharacterized protein n=1 Tax=Dovyalis caffra TaxID=77055 RepID=A0AAV1R730_9ROSI|nr:unnamed protein product [Dovyalis caffra]
MEGKCGKERRGIFSSFIRWALNGVHKRTGIDCQTETRSGTASKKDNIKPTEIEV